MSSSTSSSDGAGAAGAWPRFIATLMGAAALFCALFLAAAFLLDPYDTGRSPFELRPGLRPQGPRTALASRGRDPRFTGAIFGNSHIQLVSPERLAARTGIPFVSLTAPGTQPKEILATIDWFLRQPRPLPPRAIVVGIDHHWCTADPALPSGRPFPFWLLSRSTLTYLGGLMRYDLIEEIPHRLAYLAAAAPQRARPDGYWDYEADGATGLSGTRAPLDQLVETGGGNPRGPFPAAERLAALMAAAPAEMRLILLRPPVYVTALPRPGTMDAAADAACHAAFARLAARRPHSALVDWRVDRPELHDPNRFFDHGHYRGSIARLVEADLAAAIGEPGG